MTTTAEIDRIPFYNTHILAVQIDGKAHVVLKPAIEGLGVNYASQFRRLKGKSWARTTNLTLRLPGDTQRRDVIVVDIRTFLMLLATINEKLVAPEACDLIVKYQAEVADVIEVYYARGRTNSLMGPEQVREYQPTDFYAEDDWPRQMPVEIETIPLSVGNIVTTLVDGVPRIIFRPAVEAIGLNYSTQLRKLRSYSWANCGDITTVAADGRNRTMVTVDVPTFLMWLATVNENKVNPEVKPVLQAYQRETQGVVFKYYVKGMAPINPRVAPEQVPAVVNQAVGDYRSARERLIAEDEAERSALSRISALQIQLLGSAVSLGLIDSQWGQTKAQVIIARGFGEAPAIPQAELPLYVEDFMRSKQVPKAKITRFSGAFGKKILDQSAIDGVPIPGKRSQELPNGTIREVTAWTKEHLPVFERAWNSSYANDARLTS